jgi:hypothetical protein
MRANLRVLLNDEQYWAASVERVVVIVAVAQKQSLRFNVECQLIQTDHMTNVGVSTQQSQHSVSNEHVIIGHHRCRVDVWEMSSR